MNQPDESGTADEISGHCTETRWRGQRPIQVEVPDTRHPDFTEEARRQSAAVAASEHAADDQAFIEAISDLDV